MAKRSKSEKSGESWGEVLRTVIYALMIAMAFRTVAFQPFSIPSGSMKPTLLIGDFLFVSKYAYGYSHHSLPFSIPLFEGRIMSSEPERGDIIVFKKPGTKIDYIKRLVGLPGDKIQMREGILYINGTAAEQTATDDFIENYVRSGPAQSLPVCLTIPQYGEDCVKSQAKEVLPNGVEYFVIDSNGTNNSRDNTQEITVPDGHYFFMGDNRDNSSDSRASVGSVPFENLVGRAEFIFLSTDGRFWEIWNWRFSRFFSGL